MSTATHSGNGRVIQPYLDAPDHRVPLPSLAVDHVELAAAFTGTVLRYLFRVLPCVSSELERWRAGAAAIPNAHLRQNALAALAKRGNIEGAALFATLAPAAHRRTTIDALVAFQTAYNYLDGLSELPSEDPIANGEQLHQALLTALHPDAPHVDYYAYNGEREDGGYLIALLTTCRDAVAKLPSYSAVAPTARAAAARIVDFQALNLSETNGGHSALQKWASELTPAGSGLAWWETAAAAGSSLAVHALLAAAAHPGLDAWDVREIDATYFPWIGALHSLLDSLVDRPEDRRNGQRSLLDYYHFHAHATVQLKFLAMSARCATERLWHRHSHRVILTAMCSYYLSAPECSGTEARTITRTLTRALGIPLQVAIAMFRSRRLLHTLTHRAYT